MRKEGRACSFLECMSLQKEKRLPLFPALISIASMTLVFSCGIESGSYQYSPPNLLVEGFNIFYLSHNSSANNLPGFLGYDLYYRFYDDATVALGDQTYIAELAAQVSSSAETVLEAMKSRGLSLAGGKRDDVPLPDPLFSVSATEASGAMDFMVTMSQAEDWLVDKPTDEAFQFVLVRAFSASPSFAVQNVVTGSDDYEGSSIHPAYVVFAGVARATDPENFLTSYSLPSSILITLPTN